MICSIFDDDNDSFDEVRNPSQVTKKPIRRVKEVFEKKGITEAITEMFADHFEDLMLFMKQKMEENKKEEAEEEEKDDRLQAYIDKIRRVSCYRVNKKRHSPVMMGRLLGRSSNKKEVFIANTGTSVIILPVNIARRNGITWTQIDEDEPQYQGVTSVEVDVMSRPMSGPSSIMSREDTTCKCLSTGRKQRRF